MINFGEDGFGGSSEAETFSWRVVVRSDDVMEVGRRIICWRCGAREIASEPTNGVLDAALLPRAVRVAKIGFQAKRRMADELAAIVESDGALGLVGQVAQQAVQ